MNIQQKSTLMRLSWKIQKIRKYDRSKSLLNAWAIYLNEDITFFPSYKNIVTNITRQKQLAEPETFLITLIFIHF
ncbi:hypothetical protein [Niabella ginsengisoli]|uniref:Uncharacterized protein n=1 Tax=Niabella ginsengisoli TaxID=522298 RepID=A0ABS9SHZ8_9BACT|nr:hypothetical protein [Niabella ginsengisoli]MCH5597993.1 hypothetical protein [Niabella ginsengisoli]